MRLRCPICRSTGFITFDGLASHLRQDHTAAAVARALASSAGFHEPQMCVAKRYPSAWAAGAALAAAPSLPRVAMSPIYCGSCKAWHLAPSVSQPRERTTTQ